MRARIDGDLHLLGDYVINNVAAWVFPEIANEKPEDRERALAEWERTLRRLIPPSSALSGRATSR